MYVKFFYPLIYFLNFRAHCRCHHCRCYLVAGPRCRASLPDKPSPARRVQKCRLYGSGSSSGFFWILFWINPGLDLSRKIQFRSTFLENPDPEFSKSAALADCHSISIPIHFQFANVHELLSPSLNRYWLRITITDYYLLLCL